MSRIDFNDDKLSLEINRINTTVNKLNDLTSKVKNKQNQVQTNIPKLKMAIDMLEGEKLTLKKQLQTMQKSTKKMEKDHHQEKMSMLKQISELEKQVEKKSKEIKSQNHIEVQDKDNLKYKKMYEQALEEIEELKSINMKQGLSFKANFDDVQQMAHFGDSDEDDRAGKNMKGSKGKENNFKTKPTTVASHVSTEQQLTVSDLKKKNEQLQQNLATMSYKLAALFNASFEFGGAQLLDYLQTSIGLTEKN